MSTRAARPPAPDPVGPCCPRCIATPLTVTQPEERDFVRLLATCPTCGRWWFRAEALEEYGGHSYMVELSAVPSLNDLIAAGARGAEIRRRSAAAADRQTAGAVAASPGRSSR